ncbi:MAG: hypothetical protein KME64_41300 [Scytonematopsis contorta HA4267-MV1]|jgi:hypothetical protein|nr:hypothetical protein [Scytonematopsis contorta HA4267-MV1]
MFSRLVTTILASLLFIPQSAIAARRNLDGGIASIDCTIFQDGTEVLWNVSVRDESKPIQYYNFTVKVAGGEVSENFTDSGSYTTITRRVFFRGYRKSSVSATLEGFAGGVRLDYVYGYTIYPPLATECTPFYQP